MHFVRSFEYEFKLTHLTVLDDVTETSLGRDSRRNIPIVTESYSSSGKEH